LAKCLTNELGVPISFKHLQRITKDLGVKYSVSYNVDIFV